MYTRTYGKLTLALALACLPAMHVHANTCGDASPLKEQLGDAYYDLDYAPAAGKALDENTLKKILASTKLKTGTGIRHKCFGEDHRNAADENPLEFTLEDIQPIITTKDRTQITAWESSERKSSSTIIDLPGAAMWQVTGRNTFTSSELLRRRQLQTGPYSETGDVIRWPLGIQLCTTMRPLLPNEVSSDIGDLPDQDRTASSTQLRNSLPNCVTAHLIEITTDIHATSNGLVVEQTYYTNGLKSEWVTWNLDG